MERWPDLERELDAALLASERLRLRASAVVAVLAVGLSLLVGLVMPGELPAWVPPLLLSPLAIVPLVAARTLAGRSSPLPLAAQLATVVVELSLPTVGLLILSRWLPPGSVLASPLTLAYAPLLTLLVLRLDARMPALGGAVAALGSLLVWFVVGGDAVADPVLQVEALPLLAAGRAIALLLGGACAAFVAAQLRARVVATLRSRAEQERVLNLFGRHVSPAVARALLAHGRVSGRCYVAVLFLDIRGFTTLCEGRDPEAIVALLNAAFEGLVERVGAHEGIVNKFLGDGFMAVFGAPFSLGEEASCRAAVRSALEMLAWLDAQRASGALPERLRVGIGVHAGEVVTGSVGAQEREEYTVIGDVVNVASRVEGLTKTFGEELIVSEEVWRRAGLGGTATPLGEVEVRGRAGAIRLVAVRRDGA
ncbi:MAG TPA: adenylate/guanylate cyclase domain-containing protein [Myxococcota bacterium]|nr:adenylate/guanylate cyclase domain-containing protein [Myxococcota bacterium]